ncbi:NgoPII family restriction endonuclease [Candidatus Parcubacteria bacterium]|nr:NgoPII family restriction endonuclease [Candidatus Parcubacteria bacterium]
MTNILKALINLTENPITDISARYQANGRNRANNMGEALEVYVKDLLCNTFDIQDETEKNKIYSEKFSYIGNQNNPPDLMIANGDAIEVKKIESIGSQIALNSSYPKDKLYSDSSMITQDCRECEDWRKKDIIYVIGAMQQDKLKALWFVYGDCYAASKDIYKRIKNKISEGVNSLPDVEFSETKELGRVNKVDPLGITYLRIRGMWGIDNPLHVFDYITSFERDIAFTVNAIMLTEKYNSFPETDKQAIESILSENFSISDVEIKSPNNPARLLNAKLIKFTNEL